MPVLPRGHYSVILLSLWNRAALKNPDYKCINLQVFAPSNVAISKENASEGLRKLQMYFNIDAGRRIKAGEATTFDGDFNGKVFRVTQTTPIANFACGYVYTKNSPDSRLNFQESLTFEEQKGFELIR